MWGPSKLQSHQKMAQVTGTALEGTLLTIQVLERDKGPP